MCKEAVTLSKNTHQKVSNGKSRSFKKDPVSHDDYYLWKARKYARKDVQSTTPTKSIAIKRNNP